MARGKVLRDTAAGKGIISSAGIKHEFDLAGAWKSDVAPEVGMVVNFELDDDGNLAFAEAVDEKILAKEQAEIAIAGMKEHGSAALAGLVSKVGKEKLIALGILIISWFFLRTFYMQFDRYATPGMTFWQMLGMVNTPGNMVEHLQQSGNYEKGLLGILAIIGIAGPLAYQYIKSPYVHLLGCIPLMLMTWVGYSVYSGIHDVGNSMVAHTSGLLTMAKSQDILKAMAEGVVNETLNAIKFSLGFYLATASSIYLALRGLVSFFVEKRVSSYK